MNSATTGSPISELERFTRLRTRPGVTDAKAALAPQYLRKLRKGLNLNYFGQKNRGKITVSKLLGKKLQKGALRLQKFYSRFVRKHLRRKVYKQLSA